VPVLDPGRGRTKSGRLWSYARDDRPCQGPLPPAVAYIYSENRQGVHPQSHLAAFAGVLQVDGYAGFKALAGEQKEPGKERKEGAVQFAFCWAHNPAQVPRVHWLADRRQDAAADRRTLPDRGAHSRPPDQRAGPAKPRAGRWSRP